MPLPLIPFAIKGAIVLGKFIATHAAATTAVTTAVSTYGAAAVASAAYAGCVVIGGIKWSIDTVNEAEEAFELLSNGEIQSAAIKLMKIANSIHSVEDSLANELTEWLNNGAVIDDNFEDLVKEVYAYALDAKEQMEL